ncbi:Outward-rectifier potassium channel TOK1 [Pseudocercospora fuligena]|uniref:Outward-rectifier potassium channel TOK1 n=1 Tax=Pseudocercospora fuligena TaxID=685502 RepID=A0A8H6R906_9PEZI|nr:Outward-rectifier potassium channel TOK1 [Pseudocercospora fuligena]
MSAIDPGIEDTLKEAAEDVDDRQKELEEEDLMAPSTWWFASTACPLLAATFGPIANGFSICALVYSWRAYIPPGGTQADGIKMQDPAWLLAVNAVSLVSALTGNMSLLLNMAKRIKFSTAQPITITGFLLAGVLLIADMAAINSASHYYITEPRAIPSERHALTSAYYYAIFAAAIYMIIGFLMCLTVYGANKGYYDKRFNLTSSQRTLMLQTMSFVGYLLLGALVFSKIEGWKYLDSVYWADTTLLTVGLGDYSPQTAVGRGLLFPFAIGGILMVGLVVGSIRSLVLERGKEKMAARITEKRRESAINNVDERRQTIKVSWFARAEFSTDSTLSPAQRREEEFNVMRKVQAAADAERRYFSLFMSLLFAIILWLVGAVVFMECETEQKWTYFQAVYFTFTSLLTIGYGDLTPSSNSGKAFFVIWSLLAVPSLTILISNMGDTFVKWFADITNWVASVTVLPEQKGVRYMIQEMFGNFTAPGILGMADQGSKNKDNKMSPADHPALSADAEHDTLDRDIHFYHYILSREIRSIQAHLNDSPPKQYSWHDWEYYLRLIGSEEGDDVPHFPGQKHPNVLVPDALRQPEEPFSPGAFCSAHGTPVAGGNDGRRERANSSTSDETMGADKEKTGQTKKKRRLRRRPTEDPLGDWSWLSDKSPLLSPKSEAEWLIDRLSAALERELNRQRKGFKRKPPVAMSHVMARKYALEQQQDDEHDEDDAGAQADTGKKDRSGESGAKDS